MAESKTYNSKTGKWETRTVEDWTPQERTQYGVGKTGTIDTRTANAILKQRRAIQLGAPTEDEISAAEENAYNAGASTTGKGGGGDPYANLLKSLRGLGDYAAGNVNSSMDALTRTLQAQSNPFANFQAQNTGTTPELQQLLQSQGVSADPLQQYAAAINAQNMGQASAFQNQANTMRDIYSANQQGSIADVGQQRADLMAQLQGNVFGAGKTLLGKKPANRNQVLQMILEAMKAGK